MANIMKIKEVLLNDHEKIISLLEALDYHNIKLNIRAKEIRFSRDYGKNPTAVVLKLDDNLSYVCYSTNKKGDIITLVQDKDDFKFRDAINFICKHLNIKPNRLENKIKLPFSGFYKNILRSRNLNDVEYKTYDESILNDYISNPYIASKMFLKDGISCETQEKYKVGYDLSTMRITIPWYSPNGDLVGLVGRYNSQSYDEDGVPKYLSLIRFFKSDSLFGFAENYHSLIGETVFIVEAEKSVMQAHSIGIHNVVALGSNNISPMQEKYIKILHPKNIIICFDEGLKKENIIAQLEKFKNTQSVFKYNLGYIYDEDNMFMQKGSKSSPFDLGNGIRDCIKKCLQWI